MKIVVTGGAGMIGSNLVSKLVDLDHEVTVIDNLWRGSIWNLEQTLGRKINHVNFINADLSCLGEWMSSLANADCVYHLADIVAGIGYVFKNEGSIFRRNLQINSAVVSACEIMRVGRYIYVGTACSFPKELQYGVDSEPLREKNQFPASPESAYGWSKLMGELDAGYLEKYSNIPAVILVLHNVYGTPCDFKSERAQVIPSLVNRALEARDGGVLSVWGDGSQGRDFIHVDDVVQGLILALTHGHGAGPIQLGSGKCTSIREIAETIVREVSSSEMEIYFDTTKPVGDLGRRADFTKAQMVLNWNPMVGLDVGLKNLIHWVERQKIEMNL